MFNISALNHLLEGMKVDDVCKLKFCTDCIENRHQFLYGVYA